MFHASNPEQIQVQAVRESPDVLCLSPVPNDKIPIHAEQCRRGTGEHNSCLVTGNGVLHFSQLFARVHFRKLHSEVGEQDHVLHSQCVRIGDLASTKTTWTLIPWKQVENVTFAEQYPEVLVLRVGHHISAKAKKGSANTHHISEREGFWEGVVCLVKGQKFQARTILRTPVVLWIAQVTNPNSHKFESILPVYDEICFLELVTCE